MRTWQAVAVICDSPLVAVGEFRVRRLISVEVEKRPFVQVLYLLQLRAWSSLTPLTEF